MAIYTPGPLAAAISGKVGSVVFVNSKRARTVRPVPTKLAKSSPFLARSRVWLSNVRRQWSTLTAPQQDAWSSAAAEIPRTNRLGQTSPLTGFTYYVMTHTSVFLDPRQFIVAPPTPSVLDEVVSPTCAFSVASGLDVSVDGAPGPLLKRLQVYGWPFWFSHTTNNIARLVFLAERNVPPAGLSVDLTPEWESHFGPVQLGQRYSCVIKARFSASPFAPSVEFRQTVVA